MFARSAAAPSILIRLLVAMTMVLSVGGVMAQEMLLPPENHVLDDTRALTDSQRAAVVAGFAKFRADFGYDLWLDTTTFLPTDRTIRQYARDLRRTWSGDNDAVILVYDRATDNHAFSFSPGVWNRYPTAGLILLLQNGVIVMADKQRPIDQRLNQITTDLIRRLRLLEKQRAQLATPLPTAHKRLASFFIPLLIIGAVTAGVAGIWLRRQAVWTQWQVRFPAVQVGLRLGAPYGGGVTVEWKPMSFQRDNEGQ